MKKILFLLIMMCACSIYSYAKHEKGGWILYEYLGKAADTTKSIYKITATIFYSCTVTGPRGITIAIYDGATNSLTNSKAFTTYTNESSDVSKTTFSPCLSNRPNICYVIDTYEETVTLDNNTNGYLIGIVTAGHRIKNIVNIENSDNTSLAMEAKIPGTINGIDYHINTSPTFLFKDTAIICYNGYFDYQFSAIDTIDHDSLSYSFGGGEDGASDKVPPYAALTYTSGYSGSYPLGKGVTIDPVTGLISGVAPSTVGEYVIDVYVKEWRNGVLIDSVRKGLQVYVNNCSLLSASLQKVYVNCDSLTLSFQNESTASNVNHYVWNFGDINSSTNVDSIPVATHTYTTAGDYKLTLSVSNDNGCSDKATATVKVYPGFTPQFTTKGSCYQSPFSFTNATVAKYGVVNSWAWNFGEPASADNTATTRSATHQYSVPKTVSVILNVASSVGCSGSDTTQVVVNDKPYINLPFKDTLICSNDTLPLIAQTGAPIYSWSPTTNMLNANSLTPRVFPQDTTIYTITVQENGCVGSASIQVNVLPYITVSFNPDTMHVCKTGNIVLSPVSYALSYLWSSTDGNKSLSSNVVKYPKATPTNDSTTYYVSANLGHCQAEDSVKVYASPYPKVNIIAPQPDTTICYGSTITLLANKTANLVVWSPSLGLNDSSLLSPMATPLTTTTYTISVQDTFYCPKIVAESVLINVIPQFYLTAGDDTTAVIHEPLKLLATVTDTTFKLPLSYSWLPTAYIDQPLTYNPTLTATPPIKDSIRYQITGTTAEGCTGTGYITVKYFTTKPDIFIPSAFTPNDDQVNDILIPIPVGITHFNYFRVYNRYGQLVFSTNQAGKG